MEFVVNGKIFRIADLSEEMDKAFLELISSFLGNNFSNIDSFYDTTLRFFENDIYDYNVHNNYFNNFTHIWHKYLESKNFLGAENVWKLALKPVLKWEQNNPGHFIHKGTAFYFWGMTAIKKDEIDQGYALMHRALQEDERTFSSPHPDTPPFAFAILDFENIKQAFQEWPLTLAKYLSEMINNYNTKYQKRMEIYTIRDQLLKNLDNIDITYLFSYTLARLFRLEKIPKYILTNNFAGQIEANLLFDLTLIVETAIKIKNPKEDDSTLFDQLKFLNQKVKIGLTKKHLKNLNGDFKNNFQDTITSLLDHKYKFDDQVIIEDLAVNLAVLYGIRNNRAHSILPNNILWKRFQEMKQCCINSLLISVEYLYKPA